MTRSVIVTGAASGIGEAIVSRLAANGDQVLALDISADVERDWGGHVIGVRGDASEPDTVNGAAARCAEEFGGLDGAVACAGVVGVGTVLEVDPDTWDRVLRVNLGGVYLLARAVIPRFVDAGTGSFVAIASQCGLVGYPRNAAYAAAKAGVVNLMRCVAIDHAAQGIRANAVCPGPIDTPMTQAGFAASGEDYSIVLARVPAARMGLPAEVASITDFLLSDDAAYVNGAAWTVDGGYTAI